MRTLSTSQLHRGMKRIGAIAAVYSRVEDQGTPSALFAGCLPTNWEEAGP